MPTAISTIFGLLHIDVFLHYLCHSPPEQFPAAWIIHNRARNSKQVIWPDSANFFAGIHPISSPFRQALSRPAGAPYQAPLGIIPPGRQAEGHRRC